MPKSKAVSRRGRNAGRRFQKLVEVQARLRGTQAGGPASVCAPLQTPDLRVFVGWRGEPPFGKTELEQLVGVSDRLVVDSSEWRGLPRAYARLAELFERVAASDIAWARTSRWRAPLPSPLAQAPHRPHIPGQRPPPPIPTAQSGSARCGSAPRGRKPPA